MRQGSSETGSWAPRSRRRFVVFVMLVRGSSGIGGIGNGAVGRLISSEHMYGTVFFSVAIGALLLLGSFKLMFPNSKLAFQGMLTEEAKPKTKAESMGFGVGSWHGKTIFHGLVDSNAAAVGSCAGRGPYTRPAV